MGNEINVLIVEDGEFDVRTLERMLDRCGLAFGRVEAVSNLAGAVERIRVAGFDLVILDLCLPDSRGLETVDSIRSACPAPAYVVITGDDTDELDREAITRGAEDYLIKGCFDGRTLRKSIEYAIERRRTRKILDARLAEQEEMCRQRDLANRQLQDVNLQLEASIERAHLLAQEATVANHAKTRFLANMSHEIRTPLNAIMGFVDLLASEPLTDRQREYAGIIQDSGQNLLGLINGVLDLARIEAEAYPLNAKEISLRGLMKSVDGLMRRKAAAKGLVFEVAVADEIPDAILADSGALRQGLLNVVDNAVKFTEQGSVRIKVFRGVSDRADLVFEVTDTGIGIPTAYERSLFSPFMQADGASTRKYGGAGLGLSITHKLVQLMGGRLQVQSSQGKGTTVTLRIPTQFSGSVVAAQPQPPCPCAPSQPLTGQSKFSGRVLVVEDCHTNAMLIETLIRRMGLEVMVAGDGRQAVDLAGRKSFDLIFMDVQMPVMDGLEATRLLRSRGLDLPIVALTANVSPGDREQCLLAGCDEYVAKPFERQTILAVLQRFIGDRPGRGPAASGEEGTGVSLIDWPSLIEMYGTEAVTEEIMEAFGQEAPTTMARLVRAMRARDPGEVRTWAHKLKGAAVTIAANPLAKTADELEQAAKHGRTDLFDAALAAVDREYQALLGELRARAIARNEESAIVPSQAQLME